MPPPDYELHTRHQEPINVSCFENVDRSNEQGLALKPLRVLVFHLTAFSLAWMNASIPGRYGFRRKSEQRSAALARAWTEVVDGELISPVPYLPILYLYKG